MRELLLDLTIGWRGHRMGRGSPPLHGTEPVGSGIRLSASRDWWLMPAAASLENWALKKNAAPCFF
jgi:hypothetical protein